jgi:hypothetical protein
MQVKQNSVANKHKFIERIFKRKDIRSFASKKNKDPQHRAVGLIDSIKTLHCINLRQFRKYIPSKSCMFN